MGTSSLNNSRTVATTESIVAGSPGPFDKNTPSGFKADISAAVVSNGTTVTSTPRSANDLGVAALIPRSRATTLKRVSLGFTT